MQLNTINHLDGLSVSMFGYKPELLNVLNVN